MLTGLKLSSLVCKRVFKRPEHNAKRRPHETQQGLDMKKWYIPADRAKRVDEKNGVICLVIIFSPGFIVIKV